MIGVLIGVEGTTVELPIAALAFDPPPGMVAVTPRPPALYECVVHRRLIERARLSLYVVPTATGATSATDATDEEAWARAMALIGPPQAALDLAYELENDSLSAKFTAGPSRRLLRLVRVDHRRVLLDFWGESADVESLSTAFDATVASVRHSDHPVADATGPAFQDDQTGFRLRLPFPRDDAHEPVLLDGKLLENAPPLHAGLDASFKVALVRADLDLALPQAATALRARTLAVEAALEADDPAPGRAGAFDAVRVDYRGKDGAQATDWLIDLPRHRLLVTASARESTMVNVRPAFEAAVASFAPARRRLDAAPASRRDLGEVGISFLMPDRLARSRRTQADELIAFVEDFTKTPAPRVVVRSVDRLEDGADLGARLRATLLARIARSEGLVLDAPRVSNRSLNGRAAASAGLDVDAAGYQRSEHRVLIADGDGAIEFTFECDVAERDVFDDCREAILLSLQWTKAVTAPELAPAITDARCGLKLRPPAGFTRALDDERRVRFVEGGSLGGAFVEAAVVALPTANRFVEGAPERMRQSIGHRLTDEGLTLVRVELAPATTTTKDGADDVWVTAAYSKDGAPWRELRRDVLLADRVVEIRLAAPAARYRELRQLAEASLRTLGW